MNRNIFFSAILISIILFSFVQPIRSQTYNDCDFNSFCLDCGDIKGGYNGDLNEYFTENIPEKFLKGIEGVISVQIIIDSNGKQCVKNIENNILKIDLKSIINSMTGWRPAIKNGKAENVSLSLIIEINANKMKISYKRIDYSETINRLSKGDVEIKNKKVKYKNTSSQYKFEVYTTQNSVLPFDMTRAISIDTNNTAWLGTDNGIVKINNGKMTVINSKNSPLIEKFNEITIMSNSVDKYNNKWFTDGYNTYKFDGNKWFVFDSLNSPLNWTNGIYSDEIGNVWFQTFDGLVKFDGKNWKVLNIHSTNLPSNNVSGVFVDKNKRIWIGTTAGNIMIDSNKITNLKNFESPLNKASILKGFEDKKGNLWFSLDDSNEEFSGLAEFTINGKWILFNISNSDIPSNDILDFVIDEKSNVIWLSINKVGICRFDGKNWDIFTPDNSPVPST